MAGTWTDTDLPIWSLPERGERGPKPRHSRTEIAAAAVRIADAEGIAAVTMRRVAAELGTGTMSLYNYVPAKEHLVQLMADQTAGEYTYPRRPPQDSREAIADLGRQGRDIARRHPWLPAVMHRPPPMGPSTLRYIDYFLGLLASTGLGTAAKMETIAIINGFALMYGAMQAALDDERARTGITEAATAGSTGRGPGRSSGQRQLPKPGRRPGHPITPAANGRPELRLLPQPPHRRRAGLISPR